MATHARCVSQLDAYSRRKLLGHIESVGDDTVMMELDHTPLRDCLWRAGIELFSMLVRAWNAHFGNRKIKILRLTYTKKGGDAKDVEVPVIKGL